MTRLQAASLEPLSAATRTEIIATELVFQQLVTVNDADAPLHVRLGRESLAPLARSLKSGPGLRTGSYPWSASFRLAAGDSECEGRRQISGTE